MPIPMATAMLGGAALSGVASYFGQKEANETNIEIANASNQWSAYNAQKQMDFQERMSNTSHQREMADLKAAGLNPMLALMKSGASTPSGSAPTGAMTRVEDSLGKGVASAIAGLQLKKDLEIAGSQVALNKAAEHTSQTQAALNQSNAKKAALDAQTTEALLPAVKQRAKTQQKVDAINEKMAVPDAYLNRVGQATGAFGNLFPKIRIGGGDNSKLPGGVGKTSAGDLYNKRTGEVLYEP